MKLTEQITSIVRALFDRGARMFGFLGKDKQEEDYVPDAPASSAPAERPAQDDPKETPEADDASVEVTDKEADVEPEEVTEAAGEATPQTEEGVTEETPEEGVTEETPEEGVAEKPPEESVTENNDDSDDNSSPIPIPANVESARIGRSKYAPLILWALVAMRSQEVEDSSGADLAALITKYIPVGSVTPQNVSRALRGATLQKQPWLATSTTKGKPRYALGDEWQAAWEKLFGGDVPTI